MDIACARPGARFIAVLTISTALACGKNAGDGAQPASAHPPPSGAGPVFASVQSLISADVSWSVQEGNAGGAVTSAGLYTAPSSPGTYHVVATSTADASKSGTATVVVSASSPVSCEEAPADRSSRDTPLTVCTRTVPEEVAPSIQCEESAPKPSQCTAHEPCGAVTGCALERNEAIAATVTTTYSPGPTDYHPPAPPAWEGEEPIAPMGAWMQGESTGWFARPRAGEPQTIGGTDQPGSCDVTPVRDLMIVAISSRQYGIERPKDGDFSNPVPEMQPGVYNYSYWCGSCAELVGRSGRRVRVQVVTQCTGCPANHIDLPANYAGEAADTPFAMIDDPTNQADVCEGGRQPVSWRIVPCEVCGGVVLSYVPGFNAYTPAFTIRNHRLPIVGAEAKHDGQWVKVQRSMTNWFFPPRSAAELDQPLEVRITAIDGATITGSFPPYEAGRSYETTNQF
jgi:hypothetical protein